MNRKIEVALAIGNIAAVIVIPAVYLLARESETLLDILAGPIALLFVVWVIAMFWIGIRRWISRRNTR